MSIMSYFSYVSSDVATKGYVDMLSSTIAMNFNDVPTKDVWEDIKGTLYEDEFLLRYGFSSREEVEEYFNIQDTLKDGVL